MALHKLKTWIPFFNDIQIGKKTFDLRKDDRDFQVGDLIILQEFNQKEEYYTGRELKTEVTYILPGGFFGLTPGYCILGIKILESSSHSQENLVQLWNVCQNFIHEYKPRVEESIYQVDDIREGAPDLVRDVCNCIGYYTLEE